MPNSDQEQDDLYLDQALRYHQVVISGNGMTTCSSSCLTNRKNRALPIRSRPLGYSQRIISDDDTATPASCPTMRKNELNSVWPTLVSTPGYVLVDTKSNDVAAASTGSTRAMRGAHPIFA